MSFFLFFFILEDKFSGRVWNFNGKRMKLFYWKQRDDFPGKWRKKKTRVGILRRVSSVKYGMIG